MSNLCFRKIKENEYEFLNEMLYEAIFIPENLKKPDRDIIEIPELSKYTKNWNKDVYDIALVAVEDH